MISKLEQDKFRTYQELHSSSFLLLGKYGHLSNKFVDPLMMSLVKKDIYEISSFKWN